MIKRYDKKQNGEERIFFYLHFHITVCHLRKTGQELKEGKNLKVGADTEDMDGCCLLACSPWLAQPALL